MAYGALKLGSIKYYQDWVQDKIMNLELSTFDQTSSEFAIVPSPPTAFAEAKPPTPNSPRDANLSGNDFKRAIALSHLAQVFDNLLSKADIELQIIEQASRFFNAPAAFVAEYFPEQKAFFITSSQGLCPHASATWPIELEPEFEKEVFSKGQLLFCPDLNQEKRFEVVRALPELPTPSFLAVPLTWRKVRVGVLGIYPTGWGLNGALSENEQELAHAAANLIGQVLFNGRFFKESELARNDFIEMLVYGLKGPMASIMGALDLLYDSQGPNVQSAELLSIARRNGAKMLTMIETLLDLNKLEHEELKLDQDRVRLKQVIEITWQAMEDHFQAKGLEARVKMANEQIRVRVDLSRIIKILHHLLENALNFTEQGTIELEVEERQNENGQPEVLLAISDTGCGLSQEKLHGIFDRFSHARQYRQYDISSGGGLGLNYAKVVINAHNGKIWAESPGRLGDGTTFYFTLPIYQPEG